MLSEEFVLLEDFVINAADLTVIAGVSSVVNLGAYFNIDAGFPLGYNGSFISLFVFIFGAAQSYPADGFSRWPIILLSLPLG